MFDSCFVINEVFESSCIFWGKSFCICSVMKVSHYKYFDYIIVTFIKNNNGIPYQFCGVSVEFLTG